MIDFIEFFDFTDRELNMCFFGDLKSVDIS